MKMDLLKMEAVDLGTAPFGGSLPGEGAANEIGRIMAAGRVVFLPDRLKKPRPTTTTTTPTPATVR
jgi:hypothetical protein